jgi:hypothetical protein
MKYIIEINLLGINYSESLARVFSKELLKLNVLNKMWFQEYKSNQEIKLGNQGLRDSELKWQFIYDFNLTMSYFMEGSIATIRCH